MASVVERQPGRMPAHHLDDALLLDYAAGACGEAESLVVATHLALCPACRDRAAELDRVGGALLEDLPPAELSDGCLDAVLAMLDVPESEGQSVTAPAKPRRAAGGGPIAVPQPLRDYLDADLDGLDWRSVTRGIDEVSLATAPGRAKAKLLRIRAGTRVPAHTHEGSEITLVLSGGFADGRGHFLRGDVALSDSEVDHSPVADDDGDCICLVVTDAPLKLTGRIGRFLNPFFRF